MAGYAAVSQVLRSPAFAPPAQESRPDRRQRPALALLTRSILEASPEAHGRMRLAIAAAFTPRRIAALEPAIAAAAGYPRPGAFDPARAGSKPLSFGAGPHICLGNALARLEAAIAFRGFHTLPVATSPPSDVPLLE